MARTYVLVYPDGTRSDPLEWEERRKALDAAPMGTEWRTSDGRKCGVVAETMYRYHIEIGRIARSLSKERY